MSKKKTGSIPTTKPKEEQKQTINMNEMNLKKQYIQPAFRSGGYMTEKDRPRKKDWKKEYSKHGW